MKYSAGETVRLNNGAVALLVADLGTTYVAQMLQGDLPPLTCWYAGGFELYPEYIRCGVKAIYVDEPEPEPKPITAIDARKLVGRAAVEFGFEVTANRMGPDKYELGICAIKDGEQRTHYFTDANAAGRFLNRL